MIGIPRNIKILYWLINTAFWLLVMALGVFLLSRLLLVWGIGFDFLSKLSLPVDKQLAGITSVVFSDIAVPVEVSKVFVTVDLADLSNVFQFILSIGIVLILTVLVFIMSRFRNLLKNVCDNIVFDPLNTILLKQASYGIFLLWFIQDVILQFYYRWHFDNLKYITVKVPGLLFSNYLIFGIVTMSIAFIFERGLKLQEEQELTI